MASSEAGSVPGDGEPAVPAGPVGAAGHSAAGHSAAGSRAAGYSAAGSRAGRAGRGWMLRHSVRLGGWALQQLPLNPDARVLQIDSGQGLTTRQLLELLPAGYLDAMDPDPVLLARCARRNAVAVADGRPALHRLAVPDLPTHGGVYDVVVGVHSPYGWVQPVACLAELRDVLRPGGWLALAYLDAFNLPDLWQWWLRHSGGCTYRPGELGALLEQAGLVAVRELRQPGDRGAVALGQRPASGAP